jgi:hypothetical protein
MIAINNLFVRIIIIRRSSNRGYVPIVNPRSTYPLYIK